MDHSIPWGRISLTHYITTSCDKTYYRILKQGPGVIGIMWSCRISYNCFTNIKSMAENVHEIWHKHSVSYRFFLPFCFVRRCQNLWMWDAEMRKYHERIIERKCPSRIPHSTMLLGIIVTVRSIFLKCPQAELVRWPREAAILMACRRVPNKAIIPRMSWLG